MKITDCIEKFATPKATLARRIGIHRVQLYAFLDPGKYPTVTLTEETLQKIADFEGRSLRAVRSEYERKAVA